MKKFLLSIALLCSLCINAQTTITTHSSCDSDCDGEVTVVDATNTVNKVIKKAANETEVVTVEDLNALLKKIDSRLSAIEEKLGIEYQETKPVQYVGYAAEYTQVLGNETFATSTVENSWTPSNTPMIKDDNMWFWIITTEDLLGVSEIGYYTLNDIFYQEINYNGSKYNIYCIGPVAGSSSCIDVLVKSQTKSSKNTGTPQYIGYTNDLDNFIGNSTFEVTTIEGDWDKSNTPIVNGIGSDDVVWLSIATTEDISTFNIFGIKSDISSYLAETRVYNGNTYKLYLWGPYNAGSIDGFARIKTQ